MKPESRFRKAKVIPFLKTLPNTVYLPIQQVAICGHPDFVLCVNGYFVALELKAEDGEQSKLQDWMDECVIKAGGYWFCARPSTWLKVKSSLLSLAKGNPA